MGASWLLPRRHGRFLASPWFQPKRLGSFPPATKEAWAFLDLTKEVWAFLGFSLDGIAKEAWFLLDIQRSLDVPRFLNRAWTFLDSSIELGRFLVLETASPGQCHKLVEMESPITAWLLQVPKTIWRLPSFRLDSSG